MLNKTDPQLQLCRDYHRNYKNWKGTGSGQYTELLKSIIGKFQCTTMLDYGCGKGEQYSRELWHEQLGLTLDNIRRFDPAVPEYEKEPNWDQTSDLVICLDVLYFVTESQLDEIMSRLSRVTGLVCVIALQMRAPERVSRKTKPYRLLKDRAWWTERLTRGWPKDRILHLEIRD